jgi:beta-galactosidase
MLLPEEINHSNSISRRSFMQGCAATALISAPVLKGFGAKSIHGPAQRILSLNQDWLFGGKAGTDALNANFNDAAFSRITLPHCVTPLSWQKWEPASWEDVWIYRRHFEIPHEFRGLRLFLHFDRVMAGASPQINGHVLPQHLGGFLPFEYEITDFITEKDNVLAVAVDSRWLNVPPSGSPKGPKSIDYLLPGGINGPVILRGFPSIFIRDIFAKPVNVLDEDRRLEITCKIDAGIPLPVSIRIEAALQDSSRTIASRSQSVEIEKPNQNILLTLDHLKNISLWDTENPYLYDLVVTIFHENKPLHSYKMRIGFRDARFELDGFFLNGKRLRLFGLDRHELYPYVGFAASERALRRDAEILRHSFNCNAVRCSHYPQSEAFLNACDELGLLVWEELPGWQYIGDEDWQKLALRDVEAMVRRDRNHPCIVIWGVRINESHNDPALYSRTREIAKSLDDSRPTSGTMTSLSTKDWHQDVFAFDDYHSAPDGSVGIAEPLPGVPYMISEAVGQFNYGGKGFGRKYRRAGDPALQMQQALLHAEAHNKAASYSRCAGVIAWCAFDYASLLNDYDGVKCPGIADVFRIPKLGASFYLAQVDPKVRPVIEPSFYWDFGPRTPTGPGEHAAIFSNCDRLELFVDGKPHAVLHPDRAGFPNLKYPPFFAKLNMTGTGKPELRIDGYVGNALVLSRSFSSNPSMDRVWLHADDAELQADGSDTTRLAFGIVDKFGAPRPFAEGQISFAVIGPGVIVGDNPFQLEPSGGVGAIWIKTLANHSGIIRVEAKHTLSGKSSVEIRTRKGI